MKTYLVLLLLALFSFSSCISDEESGRQLNSAFQGEWTGSYSGDLHGEIIFVVDKEGTMNGEVDYGNTKESIKGYVNFAGKFDMATKSNFAFLGILKGSNSSGKWTRDSFSGNYDFKKK